MATIKFDSKNLLAQTGYVVGALLLLALVFGVLLLLEMPGDSGAGYVIMALFMISPILLVVLGVTIIASVYRGTKRGRSIGKSIFIGCAWGAFYSIIATVVLAMFAM